MKMRSERLGIEIAKHSRPANRSETAAGQRRSGVGAEGDLGLSIQTDNFDDRRVGKSRLRRLAKRVGRS
jgi:hypothetical protein